MLELTIDMVSVRPELPFVLHDGDLLIDGTIDLLCQSADGVALFDYKFTEASDAAVLAAYREQMLIYGKAAIRAFPDAGTPKTSLVVISTKGTRLIPVRI